MWIFCCGMQRSGSTLQYQLTAHLVESAGRGKRVDWVKPDEFPRLREQHAGYQGWKVFKNHVCTEEMASEFHRRNALGVYVFRDLRDVFVSTLTKYSTSFDKLWHESSFLEDSLRGFDRWRSLPGVLVSRYEEMIDDLPAEVRRIAAHLDIPVDHETSARIAAQYSIPTQLERIESAKREGDLREGFTNARFNPHTLLHTDHISSGAVDRWAELLSPTQIALIEERARDWLWANGYELSIPRSRRRGLISRHWIGQISNGQVARRLVRRFTSRGEKPN